MIMIVGGKNREAEMEREEEEEEKNPVKPPPRVLYQIKEKGMERNNNKLKILPEPAHATYQLLSPSLLLWTGVMKPCTAH